MNQDTLKSVLKRLAKDERVTVVMTTPVPELVEELADKVAIIRKGQLVAYADPRGIVSQAGTQTFDDALQTLLYPNKKDVVAGYFKDRES